MRKFLSWLWLQEEKYRLSAWTALFCFVMFVVSGMDDIFWEGNTIFFVSLTYGLELHRNTMELRRYIREYFDKMDKGE